MRILCWRPKLAEYKYEIVYKSGKTNVNADGISRNPLDLPIIDCKVSNVNNKLNRNNPKDAETVRHSLESNSDTGKPDREDSHENDYAKINELINQITLETPSSNHDLTSEGANAENTQDYLKIIYLKTMAPLKTSSSNQYFLLTEVLRHLQTHRLVDQNLAIHINQEPNEKIWEKRRA